MKMYYLNRIYKLDPNTQELGCFCALEFQDVELNSSYIFKRLRLILGQAVLSIILVYFLEGCILENELHT